MPMRAFSREHAWLMPPTLDELVPADHGARFVAAFVDRLDAEVWEELEIDLQGARRGAAAYHPRALLSVWIYGFMTGVRSCRKLEAACRDQIPYMWLVGMQRPDHNTLWRFYKAHRDRMRTLLRRSVRTAVRAGLVELALQAVDGTRIAANASMEHTHDAKGLRRLLARTEEAISELEAQNTTGGDPPAVRLPPELANAKALRRRVGEALARVEHEEGPNQTNLTDEDAALLNTSKGNFITGYNAQSMVSPLSPQNQGPGGMLITAVDVTSSSDDHPQLVPMIEAAAENIGSQQDVVTVADAGYHSGANLAQCDARGHEVLMAETHGRKRRDPYHRDQFTYRPRTDTYLCPLRKVLTYKDTFTHGNGYRVRRYVANGQDCRTCPAFGKCTSSETGRSIKISEHEPILQRHRQLMATVPAKKLYNRRSAIVEPVFGLLKEWHGARRFLLRGRRQVTSEWHLLATAFNLKSLHAVWKYQMRSDPSPTSPLRRRARCMTAAHRPDFRRLRHFHTLVHIPRHLTHPSPNPTPPRTKTMRQPPLEKEGLGRVLPQPVKEQAQAITPYGSNHGGGDQWTRSGWP